MMEYKTFAVIGGDLRQAHLANCLARRGKKVYALFLEKNDTLDRKLVRIGKPEAVLPLCDVVVFPLPMTVEGLEINAPFSEKKGDLRDCFSHISREAQVFGGKISSEIYTLAKEYGIEPVDYLEREEMAVKNAVVTAEGAVSIAIQELPIALFGCKCLIAGHGRIAKSLMRTLNAMGAKVTVAARRYGELANIQAEGCRAVHIDRLEQAAAAADLIFNTVPARIFTKEVLAKLKKDALLIDLASKPGGVDWETASALGCRTIWALSLPGKTAPISAGEIVLDTIQNCLEERGRR